MQQASPANAAPAATMFEDQNSIKEIGEVFAEPEDDAYPSLEVPEDQQAKSKDRRENRLLKKLASGLGDRAEEEYKKQVRKVYAADMKAKKLARASGAQGRRQSLHFRNAQFEDDNDAIFDECQELNDEDDELERLQLLRSLLNRPNVKRIGDEAHEQLAAVAAAGGLEVKENATQKDPFLKYGVGIQNYFEL